MWKINKDKLDKMMDEKGYGYKTFIEAAKISGSCFKTYRLGLVKNVKGKLLNFLKALNCKEEDICDWIEEYCLDCNVIIERHISVRCESCVKIDQFNKRQIKNLKQNQKNQNKVLKRKNWYEGEYPPCYRTETLVGKPIQEEVPNHCQSA
jgi:hypothetical protein